MRFLLKSLLALSVISIAGARPTFGWKVLETKHARIFYSSKDSTVGGKVGSVIEGNFNRVARNIGFSEEIRVHVFLPPSEREFLRLTRDRIPDWGIGCAFPKEKVIVLRPSFKGKVGLEELVVHELSHVLLGQATKGARLPRWFDEGVAMWQARQWRWGEDYVMNKAVFLHQVIPLNQVDNLLLFSSARAQLAYTESFLALTYLLQLSGKEALPELVHKIASGKNFSQALLEVCGSSEREFATEWERFVYHRFRLTSMLFNSLNLWIIILSLFLAVYLVKRYRNKKTLQRWEAEEEGEH